jgi:hypothetical protein
MKTLTTLILLTISTMSFANQNAVLSLEEALNKLQRIENRLEGLRQQAISTRSYINDALYEIQNQGGPQISCSYRQSGQTLTGTGPTRDEAIKDLMKKCVAMNVNPGACKLNIQYNAQCY